MDKYENKQLITELTQKFKASVPEEEQKLVQEFENYLYGAIQNLEESEFYTTHKNPKLIELTLISMANDLTKSDLESKKRKLITDENFSKVADISHRAFQIAQAKLSGEDVNIDFNIEEEIEKMEQLLPSVETYNMEQAKTLVSEGILDLKYLQNPKTEIYSLRLAHIKDWNEQAKQSLNKGEER